MLRVRSTLGALLAVSVALPVGAASEKKPRNPAAVERLKGESATVALSDATGGVRFASAGRGKALGLVRATSEKEKADKALAFLERHGQAFGLRDARAELKLETQAADRIGGSHLTYSQHHFGVPVFGASLKAHYDGQGNLSVVNGTVVPDIDVNIAATRSAEEAGAAALYQVSGKDVTVRGSRLLIFREGLAKGVPGENHLAYEVEVGNGGDVREFIYVDAHTGKAIDRITGIHDALHRRAYDAQGLTAPGPNYPASPFWEEGDPGPPTSSLEADNMILASGETYNLFSNAFGRDSFDGAGGIMDSIFNRGNSCPNASWNGTFISFCPGVTTDDVTAHEWGHAYTQYTHNLIYAWQPGALNESYSDIWGEVVDLINGRGNDSPSATRASGVCTNLTGTPPNVTINAPPSIAGVKPVGTASFGPFEFSLTDDVVLANDGVGTASDGCCASPSFVCAANSWTNAADVAGKIALIDRGTCGFVVKAKNAQLNGAVGVIIANNDPVNGDAVINMGGIDTSITIPSLMLSRNNGTAIKTELAAAATVNATLTRASIEYDNVSWLVGEEAAAFGGAIRDMWTPTCFGDPGKVTDAQYTCSTADGGGVHSNSGVPNHAFALLVDGGTYNGHTVGAIGRTKAAHIYFRAQSVYQVLTSDFADHADSLEQSCSDLIGVNLSDLSTGAPSGQVITASDCEQVAAAAAAVELRTPPTQCNFQPILAKNPPPLCSTGVRSNIFRDTFESGFSWTDRWSVSHTAVTADFTPTDWQLSSSLPDNRPGSALFAPNPDIGTCAPGGDESGAVHLVSKQISLPPTATSPRLAFDHWLATETGWDGGNLKISVNGGAWQIVQPAHFVYNAYNLTLNPAPGNTNPMAGEPAFSGTDGGSVAGSWGRSIVDLAPYAPPGSKIRLRYDLGRDGCTGLFGWYLDDVTVYRCK